MKEERRVTTYASRAVRGSVRGLLERGTALTSLADAEFLLSELLNKPRHALYESDLTVPAGTEARFLELAQQTTDGMPVEYLLKTAAFLELRLFVDERVLIPRPETEELVTRALARSAFCGRRSAVLDIGTGSGCIAIALARALPEAHVVATDVSPAALEVAELNVKRYALADRIELLHSDLFAAMLNAESGLNPQITQNEPGTESLKSARSVVEDRTGNSSFVIRHSSFDLVVSNPPYIPTAVLATLAPSVRCHEPSLALDGGTDGMSIIRRLVSEAPEFMSPGALLALEIDPAVVPALRQLLPTAAIELDIQGLERFCFWRR